MADTLKNKKRISTTIFPATNELLKAYSAKTGIPISIIIDRALNEYIEQYEANKGKPLPKKVIPGS